MSVEDARTAIVNGRDEDLQVNLDALLAARDAEWRAAVERVREGYYGNGELRTIWNAALDALLREVHRMGDGR